MIELLNRIKTMLNNDQGTLVRFVAKDIVDLLRDYERLDNAIRSRTVQEKDRIPLETAVRRSEDMGRGFMQLIIQNDGDVCVGVQDDKLRFAGIEFCTPMSGGGKSSRTLQALRELAQAMWEDQREDNVPW